jgi:hypothetical protein
MEEVCVCVSVPPLFFYCRASVLVEQFASYSCTEESNNIETVSP